MMREKLYVVPAKDEKNQPQCFVHKFPSKEEAIRKFASVAGTRKWVVTGPPIEATGNF